MKAVIDRLVLENEKLKVELHFFKEKASNSDSPCDKCNKTIIINSDISLHEEDHRTIPQLDGELISKVESHHKVKIVYISKNVKDAPNEFEKFYLNDLPPFKENTIEYIEDESGDIYDGYDHCYNKGYHLKFVFKIIVNRKKWRPRYMLMLWMNFLFWTN